MGNDEIFEWIMNYLDNLDWPGQIYINSGGGSVWLFDTILTRIEEVNTIHKITLRAIFLWSMAFDIFYRYSGDKTLEKGCDAIVHTTASEYHFAKYNDKLILRGDNVEKKRFEVAEQMEPYAFLSEEEKEKFLDWQDIFLSEDRLKIIFQK